jgi:hypothetical protein
MDTHFVYLANTSGLKVGITRHSNIPSRWIDQGAVQAVPIFRVASRHISGLLESAIAKTQKDKTNWRAMLREVPAEIDLSTQKASVSADIGNVVDELRARFGNDAVEALDAEPDVEIRYPVEQYPTKVTSLNLDKVPDIDATLLGIKGQYLIFDTGVINVRKFTGYQVAVEC